MPEGDVGVLHVLLLCLYHDLRPGHGQRGRVTVHRDSDSGKRGHANQPPGVCKLPGHVHLCGRDIRHPQWYPQEAVLSLCRPLAGRQAVHPVPTAMLRRDGQDCRHARGQPRDAHSVVHARDPAHPEQLSSRPLRRREHLAPAHGLHQRRFHAPPNHHSYPHRDRLHSCPWQQDQAAVQLRGRCHRIKRGAVCTCWRRRSP
mmetsp:Transcript_23877/g.61510  ORF Transcript_23877/g.61510 Transcript_23877/m.61510 type:complete len:201 (-) Transcript_23877:289-891(-)